jgi:hypothetical protein
VRTVAIAPAELAGVAQPGRARVVRVGFLGSSGAVFEAPAFVAGLDDVAVMREAVEQGRGHLGIAEDAGPFAEGEIGGDEDRGALVEAADEMEEQLTAGLGEGEMAEFVEDDEVERSPRGSSDSGAIPGGPWRGKLRKCRAILWRRKSGQDAPTSWWS